MPNSKKYGKPEERDCIFKPLGALESLRRTKSNQDAPCPQDTRASRQPPGEQVDLLQFFTTYMTLPSNFCFTSFFLLLLYKHGILVSEEYNFISFLIFSPVYTFFCFVLKIVNSFGCLLPYSRNWIYWSNDYPKARQQNPESFIAFSFSSDITRDCFICH